MRRRIPRARASGEEAGGDGNAPLREWARTLGRTAREAFGSVTRSLDRSARSLKAVAEAERTFNRNLGETLRAFEERFGTGITTEGEA